MGLEETLIEIGVIKKKEEVDMTIIEKFVVDADFHVYSISLNYPFYSLESNHEKKESYFDITVHVHDDASINLYLKKNDITILTTQYKKEDAFYKVLAGIANEAIDNFDIKKLKIEG